MKMKNRNVFSAFQNAVNGLIVLASETSARREIVVVAGALILLILDVNAFSLILFVLSILLLALESVNTAIEEICNYLTQSFDPRIKRIKDLGAGAILLISIAMGIVALAYFVSHFQGFRN